MVICDCSVINEDGPQCVEVKIRVARKIHWCCECEKKIRPGRKYEHVRGFWEGDWRTYKTCLPCSQIRHDFMHWGFYYGELKERIKECLGFDYTKKVE